MTIKNNIGLSLQAPSESANRLNRIVWAEEQGFESAWITDGGGRMDAFTLAGAAAVATSRIRLCLSIVPVFNRPVPILATSAMTMSHLAPGRFVLGLGSSTHAMIEGWYGLPFVKPKTRVRETIELLRIIMAGEKTDYDGDTVSSHNFRLGTPMNGEVPIQVAALRPGMLEMAGEMADGVILNLSPIDALPRMLEAIDKGAKRSGRRVEDLEISILLNTYVTDDIEAAEQEFRGVTAFYYSTPVYNKFLSWVGYDKEAQAITDGFREKDRGKTLGAFDQDLIHKFAVIGDAESCRAKVRKYWEAGINTAIINGASADNDLFLNTISEFTPDKMAP